MRAASAGLARANVLHRGSVSGDHWFSTYNAGEAIPGVASPLTWSFFSDSLERAMKGTFFDMGIMRRNEVVAATRAEDRLMDIFFGRAAANLNAFRAIGDRTPGTSGDAIEEQIFGQVRSDVASRPDYARYPVVAGKLPVAAARLTGRLRAVTAPVKPWWQTQVRPGAIASPAAARAALVEANRRFEAVMRPHTLAAMLCQGLYDQIHQLADAAGKPGLELTLATGYGDMAETAVVADLWAVSRSRLSMDEFVAQHGFHGPCEGELAARVWRIDRAPVQALLGHYADMDDARDPRAIERARGEERLRAEAELLAGLSRARRAHARLVLGLGARFIPMRGIGKAAFLRSIDVGRAAARVLGEDLVARGLLDDPDDVFMLTLAELTAGDPPAGLASERRVLHNEYLGLDIPGVFEGEPIPFGIVAPTERDAGTADLPITGAAVSPGIVEGIARVIEDASDDDLEPDEILVCRTTDPSWASIMMLASALVIDIGGPISHGAIVARELGVPCVIGTRDGTARIRTGDRLRVDGMTGEVLILERMATA